MKTGGYRVILADDEPPFRLWLRSLLDASSEFKVVGEANSGEEALALASRLLPDLVITDVDMPGGDGFELARMLRDRLPEVKVIMVSGHTGRGFQRLARREGAVALIPKVKLSVDALAQALQRALQEES